MMIALVTNKKLPFHVPCFQTLGVHPPLREGCINHLAPPKGELGGSGAHLIGPPINHSIGVPESVNILAVRGKLAV